MRSVRPSIAIFVGLWGLAGSSACHNSHGPDSEAAEVAGPEVRDEASAASAEAIAGVDSKAKAEPPVGEPEPEAEAPPPDLPPPPPSAEDFERWLGEADVALHELGVGRKPSTKARGRLPFEALERAYDEGRAQAYYADLDKATDWFVQAKYGAHERGLRKRDIGYAADARGPLAAYNLVLVRHDDERAYLHVWLSPAGLPQAEGATGQHESWVRDERWTCFCDAAREGRDFVAFKTNQRSSPHRQWGRAWVVDQIVALAQGYQQRAGRPLGIGDLSLPLGGKISDHWTHRRGVDVDVYLLDFPARSGEQLGAPTHAWHQQKRGVSRWTPDEEGRGAAFEADAAGKPVFAHLLEHLAEAALDDDQIWFFVHDAVDLLEPFDQAAQKRKPGRRYLHAKNRAFWPAHRDHVHLRWSDRPLPVGVPPKP